MVTHPEVDRIWGLYGICQGSHSYGIISSGYEPPQEDLGTYFGLRIASSSATVASKPPELGLYGGLVRLIMCLLVEWCQCTT